MATGKLYDTEGKHIEDLFLKTGRTYAGDPINWKPESAVQGTRYFPQRTGKPKGSEEHDTLGFWTHQKKNLLPG